MTKSASDRDQYHATLARKFESIAPNYGYLARRVLQGDGEDDRLTLPQFRALQALRLLGEPGTTNLELSRRMSVSPPAMTAMVDGLVDRGFVTRATDPANRRQVLIQLTDAGASRVHLATSLIEQGLARGIGMLSDHEADDLDKGLDALNRVFQHLAEVEEN